MIYVLIDTASVSWEIVKQNYYGLVCQPVYFLDKSSEIPKDISKNIKFTVEYDDTNKYDSINTVISTYLGVLLTTDILNTDEDENYYIIVSENSGFKALKDFWDTRHKNIEIVSNYSSLDDYISKYVIVGLYDDIILNNILFDLDYRCLKMLLRLHNVKGFITLLSLFLIEQNYSSLLRSYISRLIEKDFDSFYKSVTYVVNKKKEEFKRAYNKFLSEEENNNNE